MANASRKGYRVSVNNRLDAYGETDTEKRTIEINRDAHKRKKPMPGIAKKDATLINTLVHEHMHATHPKMHEATVRKNTRAAVSRMGSSAKQHFYRLIRH